MRNETRRAFTLIELLVVIAIIALLMAILMPALSRAREQGKRAVCLSHLKQMQLSWIIYADENDGRIVNGNADSYIHFRIVCFAGGVFAGVIVLAVHARR